MNYSITTKLNLALISIFVIILILTVSLNGFNERKIVFSHAEEQTASFVESYFDSVNVLMISGNMTQRQQLREKSLQHDNIEDVRIIRGEAINKLFGPGNPEQQAKDDFDRRALNGETLVNFDSDNNIFTLIKPYRALSDFKGTNCLMCHAVEEGTVLGAVRLDYSLQSAMDLATSHIITNTLSLILLFSLALLVLFVLMRKIIIKPLKKFQQTAQQIASDNDLTVRIQHQSQDEIGQLSNSFDYMVDSFSQSINQVHATSEYLTTFSTRLAAVAQQTLAGASRQNDSSQVTAESITELEQLMAQISEQSNETLDNTNNATLESIDGKKLAGAAITGIEQLASEINNASDNINKLDAQSQNVANILNVIKEIADQTNLLALNAAIEAARAGESGRGFAVVAQEVRDLASRTQAATAEIQQIINALKNDAIASVSAMGDARKSADQSTDNVAIVANKLDSITSQVNAINELSRHMTAATVEQQGASHKIHAQIDDIRSAAEENRGSASEVKEVADELQEMTRQLKELIASYKLN